MMKVLKFIFVSFTIFLGAAVLLSSNVGAQCEGDFNVLENREVGDWVRVSYFDPRGAETGTLDLALHGSVYHVDIGNYPNIFSATGFIFGSYSEMTHFILVVAINNSNLSYLPILYNRFSAFTGIVKEIEPIASPPVSADDIAIKRLDKKGFELLLKPLGTSKWGKDRSLLVPRRGSKKRKSE